MEHFWRGYVFLKTCSPFVSYIMEWFPKGLFARKTGQNLQLVLDFYKGLHAKIVDLISNVDLRSFPFSNPLIIGVANPFSFLPTRLTIFLNVSSTSLVVSLHSLVSICHLIPNINRKVDFSFGKLVHI